MFYLQDDRTKSNSKQKKKYMDIYWAMYFVFSLPFFVRVSYFSRSITIQILFNVNIRDVARNCMTMKPANKVSET